jgi:hypothetical protein
MGIDRIGKGGGAQPPLDPKAVPSAKSPGASRASEPSRPFRVEAPERLGVSPKGAVTETAASAAVAPTRAPLERLRSGEVDVHGYLELKVDEATAHLKDLPPAELTAIRKMLRDQLSTDPALADLVQHATGRPPTPPDEE